jgi:hypothetical protein
VPTVRWVVRQEWGEEAGSCAHCEVGGEARVRGQ